jgi:hypothetical protein
LIVTDMFIESRDSSGGILTRDRDGRLKSCNFNAIHPVASGTTYCIDLLPSKHNKVLLFLVAGLSHIN